MSRFFLVLLVGCLWLAQDADAALQPSGYEWRGVSWGYTAWLAKLPACQADVANANALNNGYTYSEPSVQASDTDFRCYFRLVQTNNGMDLGTQTDTMERRAACPANSTLGSGDLCYCNAGYTESNGQCVAPNPCPQGTTQQMTVLMGWGRAAARSDGALWQTMDGREFVSWMTGQADPYREPPTTICDGSCTWVADGAASDFWREKLPNSNGNVGVYRQQGYTRTGGTCTVKSPEVDAGQKGPACDGTLGTVNGKTYCAQRQAAPTGNPASNVQPKMTDTPVGSTPIQATDTTGGLKQGPNGETPGRPGDTPGLVDVSGTGRSVSSVPSTATATTQNPDGTTSTTTYKIEIETCGVPGKPACKIDESGTPSGQGFGDQQVGALGQEMGKLDSMLEGIKGTADKNTAWTMPSWFTAGCEPWNFGTWDLPLGQSIPFAVDICTFRPYLDGALTFIWVVFTFLAVLSMMQRTIITGAKG